MRLSKYWPWPRPSGKRIRPVRRPDGSTVRLAVTELEERAVPATLYVNVIFQWSYTAGAGVQNNLTID
jgi:hypothetical protein